MAGSQPIPPRNAAAAGDHHHHPASPSLLATSFRSGSPFANEILASDIAECTGDDVSEGDGSGNASQDDRFFGASDAGSQIGGPVLYKQPQGVAYGVRRPSMLPERGPEAATVLNKTERMQSLDAERSLLRDNHILPPKHGAAAAEKEPGPFSRLYKRLFSTKVRRGSGTTAADEEVGVPRVVVSRPSETSPLLAGTAAAVAASGNPEDLNEQWESAVASGKIKTTWQREAKTIAVYSRSLIVTFLLQYSINIASIFAVGRIGKVELGAVTCEFSALSESDYSPSHLPCLFISAVTRLVDSQVWSLTYTYVHTVASMTANITCYAPMQGLATSLDTLCAQVSCC